MSETVKSNTAFIQNHNSSISSEIGKSTVNVSRTEKDKAKERCQRNMQERKIEGQEQDY